MVAENSSYWIAEISRDQLLDLMIGEEPEVRSSSIEEIGRGLEPAAGLIIAIWRTLGESGRSPLPQVIVGNPCAIGDLLAWSASYLRGLGPITAQVRILTPGELAMALELKPHSNWWRLAGAAAGLVIGEVLSSARRSALPNEVSVWAARSTLSFALMRAIAIGATTTDFPSLSAAWESLRRQSGQMETKNPTQVVVRVARILVPVISHNRNAESQTEPMESWFLEANSRNDLARAIKTVSERNEFRSLALLIQDRDDLTAEKRIVRFDEVINKVIDSPKMNLSEKSFGIAVGAFWCHQGFSQQLSLLTDYVARLPEALLWLGAMQVSVPLPEALAIGEGLGWRLAREMSQSDDLFSYPRSDFALSELQLVLHRKVMARSMKVLERSRLDVEIFPGISSFVRRSEIGNPSQPELPLEQVSPNNDEQSDSDALAVAERALESALHVIRSVRPKKADRGRSKRRKRK